MENSGSKLKKENFAPVFQKALKNIKTDCIKNGFRFLLDQILKLSIIGAFTQYHNEYFMYFFLFQTRLSKRGESAPGPRRGGLAAYVDGGGGRGIYLVLMIVKIIQ